MAQYVKDYKFDTQLEAEAFARAEKENKCPSEDKYVMGPVYMDDEVIFKDISWNTSTAKWWQVTVQTFR